MDLMDQMDLPVPHEDGSFISERVSRVAEAVNNYDRHIEVRWIHPAKRAHDDPAFAIVYKGDDAREYVMFYVDDEKNFDGSVLERVYQMDQAKHGNTISKIDAHNEAVKRLAQQHYQEMIDEQNDLAHTILRSPLHVFKHDGKRYE